MSKIYATTLKMTEDKRQPSKSTLQLILNYSKSLEVKEAKKKRFVVHLN